MNDESIARDQLYEKVWTTPISRLAKEFGISNVGLAKACDKHQIPRPPCGYWAKKEHGKKVKNVPLPACNDPQLQTIRFEYAGSGSTRQLNGSETAAKHEERGQVTVAEQLRSPHPVVAATKRRLEYMKPGANGIVDASSRNTLGVLVSRKSIGRAMRILDAVLQRWESIGGTVEGNRLLLGKDSISVELTERTEAARARRESESWQNVRRKPAGKLKLSVDGASHWGLRSNWSDGKRKPLEDVLTSFVGGMIRHVEFLKQRRLDDECEARQEQRAEETREARQRIRDAESSRRKELLAMVRRFRQAAEIRYFLNQVSNGASSISQSDEEARERETWPAWAGWYADLIDPTTEAGCSPISSEPPPPENTPLDHLDLTSDARQVLARLSIRDSDALFKLSKEEVNAAQTDRQWGTWCEIGRVLRGLGYDVSDRKYRWY